MRGRELADAKADHVGRAAANGRCSELAAQLGWLVATSGRYKTSLCKTHEERPDGGIVTMCTYGAKCMFAHGRRDRRRDPLVFTYEAELCPSLAAGRECRAPSGGRDTTCAYAHAVVEVRTHPLTMLRELKAGRTPDLLRSTQRAEYPESPGRMGSPLKAPHKLMNAPVCMPVAPPPPAAVAPPAAVEAAVAQTAAAAAPRVALRLSAAGKDGAARDRVGGDERRRRRVRRVPLEGRGVGGYGLGAAHDVAYGDGGYGMGSGEGGVGERRS